MIGASCLAITGSGRALPSAEGHASHVNQNQNPTSQTEQGYWVVRAYFTDREQVARLAGRIEPWEVNTFEGYAVVEVDAAQYAWLLELGLRVEIDPGLTVELTQPRLALPGQTTGIPGYPCYRTVEETYAAAEQLVTDHPELAAWIDIGDSWRKTVFGDGSGYDLRVLQLTNQNIQTSKPKLFVLSSIHAREYAPAELNTRFAEYLVANYGIDPDVTWLLDDHEIHLLLHANPDGRERAETGLLWRKNADNDYCSNTNSRGADLNRNFAFYWGCCDGSSNVQCDPTYRGPNPSSEPETQAIQNYIRSIFPDLREDSLSSPAPADASGIFIDLHSYGQLVLWPWGFTYDSAPNHDGLRTLGRKFAYFNEYSPQQAVNLYPTDGTTDDFAYGELGLAAYTFEMGTSFFQSCSTFESQILPDNLSALIYAARVARTPYLTPAGPDSLSVNLTPAKLPQGTITRLTVQIDDTRYAGGETTQNIATAEFYIDVTPWITTTLATPYGLAAVDGAFDEKFEDVYADIATLPLDYGQHMIFVRGQDAGGNWGPFSAAFLTIDSPPTFLPVLVK